MPIYPLWDDATRTYTETDTDTGTVIVSRPFTSAENEAAERRAATQVLLSQARNAVQNNNAFLDLTSPTNAEALAQIKSLSRQVNALIRLVADDL